MDEEEGQGEPEGTQAEEKAEASTASKCLKLKSTALKGVEVTSSYQLLFALLHGN